MENSRSLRDISVNVPAEYIEEFLRIVETGLERAKLKSEVRVAMKEWWSVELCYIRPD